MQLGAAAPRYFPAMLTLHHLSYWPLQAALSLVIHYDLPSAASTSCCGAITAAALADCSASSSSSLSLAWSTSEAVASGEMWHASPPLALYARRFPRPLRQARRTTALLFATNQVLFVSLFSL